MTTDVSTLISDRDAYANTVAQQGEAFLNTIANIASGLTITAPVINTPLWGVSGITADAKDELTSQKPTRPDMSFTLPDAPIAPVIDIPSDLLAVTIPSFTEMAPSLDFPDRPTFSVPSLPSEPRLADVLLPVRPGYSLPTAPEVSAIALPDVPTIELPVLNATAPTTTLEAPTFAFSFAEEAYSSTLLDPLKAKLLADLENGGYGIDEGDEQRLFDRARERAQRQGQSASQRITSEFAASGFPMPPGALMAAQEASIEEMNDVVSEAARDITLRRSELYVQNRQFTIGEVRALETVLLQYHGSKMERALNGAKYLADVGQALYEGMVKRYNAQWDAYRTAGQFFEAQVRAVLAKLDVYKTQMEGKRLEVDIQGKRVDVYQSQLQGLQTIQSIYKTDVDAALAVGQVNQQRLEAFKARIDAYVASVRVQELQFSAYRAGVDGETARVTAYRAQADAFDSTVRAEKTRADVAIAVADQHNKRAELQLNSYRVDIQAFEAQLRSITETLRLTKEVYGADITAFQAATQALVESFRLRLSEINSNNQWATNYMQERIRNAELTVRAKVSQTDLQSKAAQFGAQFYADRIAAVQNTLQALISQITQE